MLILLLGVRNMVHHMVHGGDDTSLDEPFLEELYCYYGSFTTTFGTLLLKIIYLYFSSNINLDEAFLTLSFIRLHWKPAWLAFPNASSLKETFLFTF